MPEAADPPSPPTVSGRFPVGAAAGFRLDPVNPTRERYWDGEHWSEDTRAVGAVGAAVDTRAAARHLARQRSRTRPRRSRPWVHLLGNLTRLGLVVSALATGLTGLWSIHTYNVVSVLSMKASTPSADDQAHLSALSETSLRAAFVVLLVQAVTGVALVVWLVCVYTDPRTDARGLRHSPVVVVLCWVIPVVSLWWPLQVVSDAWYATDTRRHHARPPASPSVLAWWFLYLLAAFVPGVLYGLGLGSGTQEGLLRFIALGGFTSAVLYALSNLALFIAIGHILFRLDAHDVRDRAAFADRAGAIAH